MKVPTWLLWVAIACSVHAEDTSELSGKRPLKPELGKSKSPSESVDSIAKAKMGGPSPAKSGFAKTKSGTIADATPVTDPQPVADSIDRRIDAALAKAHVTTAPLISDGLFLRRTALDIIGRIPTRQEGEEFYASTAPDRRLQWINALLASPSYGEHMAAIWRELIAPRDMGSTKGGRDVFSPWLAAQFNANRSWNAIVKDMLTVEGRIREHPESGFILANSENSDPLPNLMADATARLFWGVQLRCAECHDHPFAPWKQEEFWSTAAFFGKLHRGGLEGKNPNGWTFSEASDDFITMGESPAAKMRAPEGSGAAIIAPESARKLAGKTIRARYLGGTEANLAADAPVRPAFADWATSASHRWFARNAVNRLWSHFFGRGFVMPLDGMFEGDEPSHPELLEDLVREFCASQFNLKQLIRGICMSRTYQRTSTPSSEPAPDSKYFAYHTPRTLRAESLYDSLSVIFHPPVNKPGSKPGAKAPVSFNIRQVQSLPGQSREEFVRTFAGRPDENHGSTVNQAIPQLLALMNGPILADLSEVAQHLTPDGSAPEQVTREIYLLAYCREPTKEESAAAQDYLTAHPQNNEGCAGLLWAVLNSSEFLVNH